MLTGIAGSAARDLVGDRDMGVQVICADVSGAEGEEVLPGHSACRASVPSWGMTPRYAGGIPPVE